MELWKNLEKEVCSLVKGKTTPCSGRLRIKGDIRTDSLYIECKHRSNKSGKVHSIPTDWLKTAELNTKKTKLIPLIAYQEDRNGIPSKIYWCCRALDGHLFTQIPLELACHSSWVQISQESVRSFAEDV